MAGSRNHVLRAVVCASVFLCASMALAAKKPVPLIRASVPPPEASLLDVQISVFDAEETGPFPEIRDAEARYMPVRLKDGLQSSRFWGVVHVVFKPSTPELSISGVILSSTSRELKLQLRAVDAAGKVWIDKKYKQKADATSYLGKDPGDEPFQDLYHRIANELVKKYRKLDHEDLARIRTVSRLRFAADLAPEIFDGYIASKKRARYEVARLPSREDPMLLRVDRIRQRDGMFLDAVDTYYADFHARMIDAYHGWRSTDYWEREAMKSRSSRTVNGAGWTLGGVTRGPLCGTPGIFGSPTVEDQKRYAASQERDHIQILSELGASLASDVAPLVLDVDGKVLRLEGSIATQYARWRELLREIFAAETGTLKNDQ